MIWGVIFVKVKLISSSLGKGTVGIGFFDLGNTISASVATWDDSKTMGSYWNWNSSVLFTRCGYWEGYSTHLYLSFLICKNKYFLHRDVVSIQYPYCAKPMWQCRSQYLALYRYSIKVNSSLYTLLTFPPNTEEKNLFLINCPVKKNNQVYIALWTKAQLSI